MAGEERLIFGTVEALAWLDEIDLPKPAPMRVAPGSCCLALAESRMLRIGIGLSVPAFRGSDAKKAVPENADGEGGMGKLFGYECGYECVNLLTDQPFRALWFR